MRLTLYTALGINEHREIKMLDSFFQHNDGFKGVVGSSFYYVSPDEIADRNDLETVSDNYDYIWKEAVANGSTDEGKDEYMQNFIDSYTCNSDGLFVGHDTSYIYNLDRDEDFLKFYNEHAETKLKGLYDSDEGTFECVGGGRCFDNDEVDMVKYVNDQRALLHDIARMFEAGLIDIETVEQILIDNKVPFTKELK